MQFGFLTGESDFAAVPLVGFALTGALWPAPVAADPLGLALGTAAGALAPVPAPVSAAGAAGGAAGAVLVPALGDVALLGEDGTGAGGVVGTDGTDGFAGAGAGPAGGFAVGVGVGVGVGFGPRWRMSRMSPKMSFAFTPARAALGDALGLGDTLLGLGIAVGDDAADAADALGETA
ncbi:hypothetical protein [Kitasatospora sp. McL0602]|uniref:hypothetical protein n=1 Tax=Kitasatospora sp. McL0602 TaxID=3439530 RepID=UPI003F8AF974